jgi:L-rhamnose mutarotase
MGQLFVSDETAPDEGMVRLDQVFHLETQLAAAGLPTR